MNKNAMKIITSCGALMLFCMLASCTEKKKEFSLGCNLNDLLLAVSELPEGSELSSTGGPIPDSTINSAGSSFYLSSHLIAHAMYWYSAEKYSIRKYEEEVAAARLINEKIQGLPTELMTNNLLADDHEIVCGDDVLAFRCLYVGRYKNYVTVLNAEVINGAISFATYNELIEVVDKKISSCE